ncbi:aldo/keto reductase [Microlunatus endophyticus]
MIGDRPISAIGLGGAGWSLGDRVDVAQSVATIHAALDAGIRLIDTARAYTTVTDESHNEDLIALALHDHPLRDEVLVATKGGHYRAGRESFPFDGRPATLRQHCEASLSHLGVDRIGLYQLHHPDPAVPIEESVLALRELQDEGKIAMIGVSNVSLTLLRRAQSVADIVSVQNQFSLFHHEDPGLLAACAEAGIAYLAYSPLGGGRVGELVASEPIRTIAAAHGATPIQVALAWLRSAGHPVIPIVGTRRAEAIVEASGASALELDQQELAQLGHGSATLSP